MKFTTNDHVRQLDIKELNNLLNNEGIYVNSTMIIAAYDNLGFDTCKKRIKGIGKNIMHHYFSWEYLAIIKPDMKEERLKWKERISQFKKSVIMITGHRISDALKFVSVDLVQQDDGSFREKKAGEKTQQQSGFDSQLFQDYVKAYSNLFNQTFQKKSFKNEKHICFTR